MTLPRHSLLPVSNDWWQLPTGRLVSVRSVEGEGPDAECVVRYLDANGAMAPGEFNLSLAYVARGKRVPHG